MLTLRLARHSDAKLVFDLSNDIEVRKNSFNQDVILWENHCRWYEAAIVDPDVVFLLGFDERNLVQPFIGQIRFRRHDRNTCELSISLSSEYRGKGMSSILVKEALTWLLDNTEYVKVLAKVKMINSASMALFKTCQFKEEFFNKDLQSDSDVKIFYYQLRGE